MRSDSWPARVVKALTPFLIYLLVSAAVELVAAFVAGMFVTAFVSSSDIAGMQKKMMETISAWSLPITLVIQVICTGIFIWMYRSDSKRIIVKKRKMNPATYPVAFVLGAALAMFLNGLLILTGLYALLQSTYSETASVIYNSEPWLMYLCTVIMAPIMEELMFRGIIYRRFRTYCIFSLAMLLSAVYFGIYHMNLLQFIYATLIGLLFAYGYEKFRGIIAPMIMHAGANLLSVLISTNTQVSGVVFKDDKSLMLFTGLSLCLVLAGIVFINRAAKPGRTVSEGGSSQNRSEA
ncbi:MAG: CPBP family intramembrane metalloprotease [Lachnospiraceae bacterium]|nr:CPBP family intramembrane metalloprotease [Lachnospiraceae bacterium]